MESNKPAKREWVVVLLAAIAAFCVYTCMYAFRKPFTSATFDGLVYFEISYKSWLVIAQTIGYTVSKFYGISFIGGLKDQRNAVVIVKFIGIAWIALLLFALVPAPYNIVFLLINGFPLGVIYGLVFRYLEGRKSTEFLGAVLASSFIFASGFTQSAGRMVMVEWGFSQWWMPFITGLLFMAPLLICTWLLGKTPVPDKRDMELRTERKSMNASERKEFIRQFIPGLTVLILAYMMLTILRDYRSNFASDMWKELGYGADASVFTKSEIPASLVVLVLMSLLVLVKSNIRALMINHLLIFGGMCVVILTTFLYSIAAIDAFWWITLSGIGLYMAYVPFNCMLFERLISSFRYAGNAGFIIYVADSFGYLGSDVIIVVKNLMSVKLSWTDFFIKMLYFFSTAGLVLVTISAVYFRKKFYTRDLPKRRKRTLWPGMQ
ncbi:MAG: hypothetical protein EOO09_12605 [Chitinophagaceae bacterium]|nr:MAG: hypothetical protein EOO09_12605 [Chitinophagaceae bacterium]